MATHSSVLAWRIPGIGEPGGLPSLGLHRVGHDWSDLAATAAGVLRACRISWFSSHPSTAHRWVTKQLCAGCKERLLIHMPLLCTGLSWAGVSQDKELTWAGTELPTGLQRGGPFQRLGLTWAAHGALLGRPLPGSGALLGGHPGLGRRKGTMHRALRQSTPSPTCWSELTLSNSEQDPN